MGAARAMFTASLLTAAVVTAGSLPEAAQAATSGPGTGIYYVQSVTTGLNAAMTGTTVLEHRPRGDEDHQQWTVSSDGTGYRIENVDSAGSCLGRSGANAALVGCAGTDALWTVTALTATTYALKDPAADRYLTVAAASGAYADQLQVGAAGDLARWYFTPVTVPKSTPPGGDQRTLDQVTFLTAHNAYANGVDGGFAPPFVNLFPNQNRGIDTQLAEGVRGFMLDIYDVNGSAVLCHQSCTLVSNPVPLSTDLTRMVNFLNAHPSEIVTVFLEDYVSPQVLQSALAKVTGLATVLFRPDQAGVANTGWPTLATMESTGKRLLIFSDRTRASDSGAGLTRDTFGVMYQREWTVENYWSMGSGTGSSDWSCYSRWSTPLTRTASGFRPLFVMNHFRDTPIAGTISTDNGKLLNRAERFCEPAARRKPTYLAVDRYDLGGPTTAVDQLNAYWYYGG